MIDAFFFCDEGLVIEWDGTRWGSAPREYGLDLITSAPTVIYPGPSAYSCLAPLFPATGTHRVGLLYERDAPGCTGPSCAIHFVPIATK